ncbi:MAG: glycoside hydrolase family 3 N-terminal domain-containing protein [Chitinophagales bacterium]
MKRKITFLLMLLSSMIFMLSFMPYTSIGETPKEKADEIDQKVADLLSKMSLKDKVGEMTQLALDMISVGEPHNTKEPHQLDPAKLKKVFRDLRVGSIMNVSGHAYTREHWRDIMTNIQEIAMKEKGIPVLYGIDAIHGTNYTVDATLFPQQITLAASWNPSLAFSLGSITAYETRASCIPWTFSPVFDLGRDVRWSRLWETFGEDVFLVKKMGVSMVKGYQGDDLNNPYHVAACMKHFLGYSTPWTGKDRTPAYIPERQLKEYFVPTFQAAIDAGAATIMISSGEMNGIPVHANPKILKDLLRDEMGFEGLAVSDWEDILLLVSRHRVAKDHKEAIKMAVNAGIDMSMVPMNTEFPVLLKELVEEGEVPMERIDEAVSRILKLKFQLGLFENPFYNADKYPDFGSEKHATASFNTALECLTLLKNNDNILPLSKTGKVLVTGPTANSINALNGGWTGTWQGRNEQYNTKGKQTILEAIQAKLGKEQVTFVEGASELEAVNIQEAVEAAKKAEVAIVCLGEMPYTEKPGDRDDLYIPDAQRALVEAIVETGTPIVLVLAEGRPRLVSKFEEKVAGVLLAYLPGNEGGRAIAEVLFGDYNPNGKLPYTYPRFPHSILTYDHKGTDQIKTDFSYNAFNPQWEFGHGLSYTTFEYSDLNLSSKQLDAKGNLNVSVVVKNTGKMDGKEVVQLYITDKVATVTPSVKRLRGFEKVDLKAGESKTVEFSIRASNLAFVGIDNQWVTEEGEFEVNVGGLKGEFEY